MAQKKYQISPGTGLANAREELQKKTAVLSGSHVVVTIHTLVSGRFCPACLETKIPIPQREGDIQRVLSRIGLASEVGKGEERRRAATASFQSIIPSGWQVTQQPAVAFS